MKTRALVWCWSLLVGLVLLASSPPTAGAQIVYLHGGDVWAMNDDGSGAHAIVTALGFPGAGLWTLDEPDVLTTR